MHGWDSHVGHSVPAPLHDSRLPTPAHNPVKTSHTYLDGTAGRARVIDADLAILAHSGQVLAITSPCHSKNLGNENQTHKK